MMISLLKNMRNPASTALAETEDHDFLLGTSLIGVPQRSLANHDWMPDAPWLPGQLFEMRI